MSALRKVNFKVLIGVLCAFAALVATLLFASHYGEVSWADKGSRTGFDPVGTYAADGELSFGLVRVVAVDHPKEDMGKNLVTFTLYEENRMETKPKTVEGVYEKTDDPNVYLIRDGKGDVLCCLHLANITRDGAGGEAYLIQGDTVVKLRKGESIPVYGISGLVF